MALLSRRAAVSPRAWSLQGKARLASRPAVCARTRLCASANGATTDLDAALTATWQRCSTLLSASGSLGLSANDPLRVFYASQQQDAARASTSGLVTFPLPESVGAAVQELVDAALPSPFGKGKETVFEPIRQDCCGDQGSTSGTQQGAANCRGSWVCLLEILAGPGVSGSLGRGECAEP